jgi:hypothetical protein
VPHRDPTVRMHAARCRSTSEPRRDVGLLGDGRWALIGRRRHRLQAQGVTLPLASGGQAAIGAASRERDRSGRASPRDAGSGRAARGGSDGLMGDHARTDVAETPELAGVRHDGVVRARPIQDAPAAEWHGLERKYVAGTAPAAHPAGHGRRVAVVLTVGLHGGDKRKA